MDGDIVGMIAPLFVAAADADDLLQLALLELVARRLMHNDHLAQVAAAGDELADVVGEAPAAILGQGEHADAPAVRFADHAAQLQEDGGRFGLQVDGVDAEVDPDASGARRSARPDRIAAEGAAVELQGQLARLGACAQQNGRGARGGEGGDGGQRPLLLALVGGVAQRDDAGVG